MADNDQQQAAAAAPPAANQHARFFKLPDFWVSSPAAWFGVAESQFILRDVTSQRDRFALVVAVLPESSARRVAHLLAAPGDNSYDELKTALLAAHQMTAFQKAEQLFSNEPLGERRPSDLLSEMLELVHPGEETTRLFALLFLRRLPAAVRLLLTEDDPTDVRALAEKADRCAASLHRHQASTIAATAPAPNSEGDEQDQESLAVAAVGQGRSNYRQRGNNGFRFKKGRGGRQAGAAAPSTNPPSDTPFKNAQLASGLCRSHFRYGDRAYSCEGKCSWQGN